MLRQAGLFICELGQLLVINTDIMCSPGSADVALFKDCSLTFEFACTVLLLLDSVSRSEQWNLHVVCSEGGLLNQYPGVTARQVHVN